MASGLIRNPENVAPGWRATSGDCQYCNEGVTRESNMCTRCTTPLAPDSECEPTIPDSEPEQPKLGSTILEYWRFFKEHGVLYVEDDIIGSLVDEIDKAGLANKNEAYYRLQSRLNEYPVRFK